MLKDIVAVTPLDGFRIQIRFEDGIEGVVDIAECVPLMGAFAALKNRDEFTGVRVNEELGTIVWPSGADLDPDVLYALVTGGAAASSQSNGRSM